MNKYRIKEITVFDANDQPSSKYWAVEKRYWLFLWDCDKFFFSLEEARQYIYRRRPIKTIEKVVQ